MEINKYLVKVKHDTGIISIKTTSTDENSLKQEICRSENCPESAIIKIQKLSKIY